MMRVTLGSEPAQIHWTQHRNTPRTGRQSITGLTRTAGPSTSLKMDLSNKKRLPWFPLPPFWPSDPQCSRINSVDWLSCPQEFGWEGYSAVGRDLDRENCCWK